MEAFGMSDTKERLLRRALVLEYFTVGWNVIEGVVAIGGGIVAGSIALLGFGFDSFIEVTSAAALIWRLQKRGPDEESCAERKSLRIVGATFFILALYVGIESVRTLWLQEAPRVSLIGIVLTIISALIMPYLGFAKRRLATQLESKALAADGMETYMCALLSVIVLVGLGLNALFGWWWADPVAGIVMVVFLIKEGREGWEGTECS